MKHIASLLFISWHTIYFNWNNIGILIGLDLIGIALMLGYPSRPNSPLPIILHVVFTVTHGSTATHAHIFLPALLNWNHTHTVRTHSSHHSHLLRPSCLFWCIIKAIQYTTTVPPRTGHGQQQHQRQVYQRQVLRKCHYNDSSCLQPSEACIMTHCSFPWSACSHRA